MKSILLLNGPPRCGKDTIGRILWRALPSIVLCKFADPIIDFMLKNYGIPMDHRDGKDEPNERLFGKTPRQVAIAYSEAFCKPLWGVDYFGKVAAEKVNRISKSFHVFAFTDSGFSHEAEALLDRCEGEVRALQIKITRPGTTFQMDSRSYWASPRIGQIDFDNATKTLPELEMDLSQNLIPEILQWLSQ